MRRQEKVTQTQALHLHPHQKCPGQVRGSAPCPLPSLLLLLRGVPGVLVVPLIPCLLSMHSERLAGSFCLFVFT